MDKEHGVSYSVCSSNSVTAIVMVMVGHESHSAGCRDVNFSSAAPLNSSTLTEFQTEYQRSYMCGLIVKHKVSSEKHMFLISQSTT